MLLQGRLCSDSGWGSAQAHRNPAVPDSLRQIQSMEPRMGPPGTEVRLYSENLPLQARVVIGLGKIGEGFEELGDGTQGEFGEIGATVRVPQSAMWDGTGTATSTPCRERAGICGRGAGCWSMALRRGR